MNTSEYGFMTKDSSEKAIILNPSEFDSFESLYSRVEEIVCNDSIPIIATKSNNQTKRIKLINPCMAKTVCHLIHERNMFRIEDDKILKDQVYHINLLDSLLMKHYNNDLDSPFMSEDPRKVIVSITYVENDINKLNGILDELTDSFDKLDIQVPFHLRLDQRIPPPPPF